MDGGGVGEEALGGEVAAVGGEVVALCGVDGGDTVVVRVEEEGGDELGEEGGARSDCCERGFEGFGAGLDGDYGFGGVHGDRRGVGYEDGGEGGRLVEHCGVGRERGDGGRVFGGGHCLDFERGPQRRRAGSEHWGGRRRRRSCGPWR